MKAGGIFLINVLIYMGLTHCINASYSKQSSTSDID